MVILLLSYKYVAPVHVFAVIQSSKQQDMESRQQDLAAAAASIGTGQEREEWSRKPKPGVLDAYARLIDAPCANVDVMGWGW